MKEGEIIRCVFLEEISRCSRFVGMFFLGFSGEVMVVLFRVREV